MGNIYVQHLKGFVYFCIGFISWIMQQTGFLLLYYKASTFYWHWNKYFGWKFFIPCLRIYAFVKPPIRSDKNMNISYKKLRKFNLSMLLTISYLIVILICFLSYYHFFRIDLNKYSEYSVVLSLTRFHHYC